MNLSLSVLVRWKRASHLASHQSNEEGRLHQIGESKSSDKSSAAEMFRRALDSCRWVEAQRPFAKVEGRGELGKIVVKEKVTHKVRNLSRRCGEDDIRQQASNRNFRLELKMIAVEVEVEMKTAMLIVDFK